MSQKQSYTKSNVIGPIQQEYSDFLSFKSTMKDDDDLFNKIIEMLGKYINLYGDLIQSLNGNESPRNSVIPRTGYVIAQFLADTTALFTCMKHLFSKTLKQEKSFSIKKFFKRIFLLKKTNDSNDTEYITKMEKFIESCSQVIDYINLLNEDLGDFHNFDVTELNASIKQFSANRSSEITVGSAAIKYITDFFEEASKNIHELNNTIENLTDTVEEGAKQFKYILHKREVMDKMRKRIIEIQKSLIDISSHSDKSTILSNNMIDIISFQNTIIKFWAKENMNIPMDVEDFDSSTYDVIRRVSLTAPLTDQEQKINQCLGENNSISSLNNLDMDKSEVAKIMSNIFNKNLFTILTNIEKTCQQYITIVS
jgi:methyl-accepting chemotaxis protein